MTLSKAISEIRASSLTAIGDLITVMCMQIRINADIMVCWIKFIMLNLLAAFMVMPEHLRLFGMLIDCTKYSTFVYKTPFRG